MKSAFVQINTYLGLPQHMFYSDKDAVIRIKCPDNDADGIAVRPQDFPQPGTFVNFNAVHQIEVRDDGVAVYKGFVPHKGMPFIVLIKKRNQGKVKKRK